MLNTAPSAINTLTIFASHVGSCWIYVSPRFFHSQISFDGKFPYYLARKLLLGLVSPEISFCIQFHQTWSLSWKRYGCLLMLYLINAYLRCKIGLRYFYRGSDTMKERVVFFGSVPRIVGDKFVNNLMIISFTLNYITGPILRWKSLEISAK